MLSFWVKQQEGLALFLGKYFHFFQTYFFSFLLTIPHSKKQRKFTMEDAEKYTPMGSRIILLSDIRPQITGVSSSSFKEKETIDNSASKVKRNAILVSFFL